MQVRDNLGHHKYMFETVAGHIVLNFRCVSFTLEKITKVTICALVKLLNDCVSKCGKIRTYAFIQNNRPATSEKLFSFGVDIKDAVQVCLLG